jgi:hypothetical protein
VVDTTEVEEASMEVEAAEAVVVAEVTNTQIKRIIQMNYSFLIKII